MRNKVFIATSFDGYIADKDGGIEWLTNIPHPSSSDGGFSHFMESIDAILMGRKTFEKVLSFGIEWPYTKKVFVWTNTLKQ
jgi:dihydrofolate reductase